MMLVTPALTKNRIPSGLGGSRLVSADFSCPFARGSQQGVGHV